MSLDRRGTRELQFAYEPVGTHVSAARDQPSNLEFALPDPYRLARWRLRQSGTLLAADAVVLMGVALLVSMGPGRPSAAALAPLVLWPGMIALAGGYRMRNTQVGTKLRTALLCGAVLLGTSAVVGLIAQWEAAREHILLTIPVGAFGLVAVRLVWAAMLRRKPHQTTGLRRVLIMGDRNKVSRVNAELNRNAGRSGYSVVDVLTWGEEEGLIGWPDGDAAVAQARDAVLRSGADLVVLVGTDVLDASAVRHLAWELAELNVELATSSGLYDVAGWRLRSESVGGLAMVHVDLPRLRGWAAIYKRIIDVVFSLLILVLISPLLLLIGLAVKLDTNGPALFRQERVGIDHSRFVMFKFRSMTIDAEKLRSELLDNSEGNGVLFKMRQDPRVTRIGKFIRRSSFDELPQFFNVLRGEMSVVGPRPPLPAETVNYDDAADRRLTVKPGITGLWQVHGRSDLDWEQSLRLDLYYVENWSPGADLRIIMRTIGAMCSGTGAY